MAPEEDRRSDRDWDAVDAAGRVRDPDARTRRGPSLVGSLVWVLVIAVGVIAVANWMGASEPPRASPPVSMTPGPSMVPSPAPSPAAGPSVRVVGYPLLGVSGSWDLFARGPGVSIRIELARGRVTATPVPRLRSGGPVSFVVGPDRVLIRPIDFVPGYVVPDDGPAQVTTGALAQGGPLVPGPDPTHVWVQTGPDAKPVMSLVTLEGSSAGRPSIPVPADMSPLSAQSDGSGSLVFQGTNGAYQVTSSALHRITTGQVVAATAHAWLVSDCDDRHRCTTALVDRGTGARRTLGPGLGEGVGSGSVAPAGRFAAVPVVASGGTSLLVIDLASGARREVPVRVAPSYGPGALAWSPDSRWLFVVTADQSLVVVDSSTWRVSSLGVALPPVEQIAIRP